MHACRCTRAPARAYTHDAVITAMQASAACATCSICGRYRYQINALYMHAATASHEGELRVGADFLSGHHDRVHFMAEFHQAAFLTHAVLFGEHYTPPKGCSLHAVLPIQQRLDCHCQRHRTNLANEGLLMRGAQALVDPHDHAIHVELLNEAVFAAGHVEAWATKQRFAEDKTWLAQAPSQTCSNIRKGTYFVFAGFSIFMPRTDPIGLASIICAECIIFLSTDHMGSIVPKLAVRRSCEKQSKSKQAIV